MDLWSFADSLLDNGTYDWDTSEKVSQPTSPEQQVKIDLNKWIAKLYSSEQPAHFEVYESTLQGVPSWDALSDGFSEIPTALIPPEKWDSSQIPIPNLFADRKKEVKMTLTDATEGIFRQKTSYNLSEIVKFLSKKYKFGEFSEHFAFYDPPCWRILSKESALDLISQLIARENRQIADHLDSRNLDEIRKRILRSGRIVRCANFPHPDPHVLCCRDKMYRWPVRAILTPQAEDMRISYLDVSAEEINPCATPYFNQFLNSLAGDDNDLATLILEIIGVIITGYPVKNFFVFEGVPNSGKSQLARFLESVLGKTSYFAVSGVNQLSGNWLTGKLPGKLLCVCSDIPNETLKASAVGLIKQLTGDDPIYGEVKYEQPFVFFNSAKLLFLSNFPLRLKGSQTDPALQQRLVRVPFLHSVPPEAQIPSLHKKLMDEAGGIIWQALQALEDWEDKGCVFSKVDYDLNFSLPSLSSTREERVRHFVDQECELAPEAVTTVAALYERFQEFEAYNLVTSPEPMYARVFGRVLSALDLPIQKDDTARERRRRGIRLSSRISYE